MLNLHIDISMSRFIVGTIFEIYPFACLLQQLTNFRKPPS